MSKAPPLTSYTDSIIINCNRQQSIEVAADADAPNSDFTNVVGEGVHLNVGDTVEVQSAFISEIGAGSDTIEIQGRRILDYKNNPILYTPRQMTLKKEYPVLNDKTGGTAGIIPLNLKDVSHYKERWVLEDLPPVELKDNEANIEVNYYKTADGHGYIFQPICGQDVGSEDLWKNTLEIGMGAPLIWPTQNQVCLADYHNVTNVNIYFGGGAEPVPMKLFIESRYGDTRACMTAIHDCSRFTMYCRTNKDLYHYPFFWEQPLLLYGDQKSAQPYNNQVTHAGNRYDNAAHPPAPTTGTGDMEQAYDALNPSADLYERYVEPKNIKVSPGFNTPSNIASSITSQLKKTKEPNVTVAGNPATTTQRVSTTLESETWKPFSVTTQDQIYQTLSAYQTKSADNTGDWPEGTDEGEEIYTEAQKALDWYNQYEKIYIKRPDLYDAGFDFYKNIMMEMPQEAGTDLEHKPIRPAVGIAFGPLNPTSGKFEPTTTHTLEECIVELQEVEYNRENLTWFKNLFEVQGRYPELMENNNWGEPFGMTRDNVRFLHLMHVPQFESNASQTEINAIIDSSFGCDNTSEIKAPPEPNPLPEGYVNYRGARLQDNSTKPIWFEYDKSNRDVYNNGFDINNKCFGFATQGPNGFIQLHLHRCLQTSAFAPLVGGKVPPGSIAPSVIRIPNKTFALFDTYGTLTANPSAATGTGGPTFQWRYYNLDQGGMILGWDRHFNSYGNVIMTGWSGISTQGGGAFDYYKQLAMTFENNVDGAYNISPAIRNRYMGANDPLFNFDTVESRFTFSRLHCAVTAGQSNLLSGATGDKIPGINNDFFKEVYKINPRDTGWEHSPSLMPYQNNKTYTGALGQAVMGYSASWGGPQGTWIANASAGVQTFSTMNPHIAGFTVFDSKTGIIISDLGFDETTWDRSIWGTLGFTYEQFHEDQDNFNFNTRVIEDNKKKLPFIVTNANIVNKDTQSFVVNSFGAPMSTTQQCFSYLVIGPTPLAPTSGSGLENLYEKITINPAITQPVDSIVIPAVNLPKKMKTGAYYAIRSDLIDSVTSLGNNGQRLPIMHICDKQYSGGDFYFSSDNINTFRVTNSKVVTSIRTQITDPDNKLARCDPDTAVIYKIIKNREVDLNLSEEILQQNKKK